MQDDDFSLFQAELRGVKPLKHDRADTGKPKPDRQQFSTLRQAASISQGEIKVDGLSDQFVIDVGAEDALYWAGMRGLSGRRRIRAVWVAAVPIAWLVLGLATQFPLENLPRAAAFHLTAALALVASVWEVLRDHRREPLPSRWPLAALLCLSAAIYATRLFYIVNDAATADGFALAFYIQILCHFGIALMIATLSKERAEARLEQAARNYPHDIVIGEGAASRSTRHQFLFLGETLLRGKEKPTRLYTLQPSDMEPAA